MKRVFLDMYLAHNLGDDLFLHIIAKRYPNCKFTVNYYNNDYDDFISQYNNIETRVTLKNRVIRKLGFKDYINNLENIAERNESLIFLGGSYFMEPVHSDFMNDPRNKMIDIFKNKGRNVFILGVNFGPYTSEEFYNHWKNVFKRCEDVCFRERYSYNLFKDIDSIRVSSDIVLGFDVSKYKKIDKKKIVGFSIIDVNNKFGIDEYYNSYIQSTIKSIDMFIKKGYKCVLMSFCEIEGDLQVINNIINLLTEEQQEQISVYEYYDDLEEAINLISSFKIFITSRFHATILGLMLDVCTIPVIYSDKILNVLDDLKLKDTCVKMENLSWIYDEDYITKRLEDGKKIDKSFCENNNQFVKLDKLLK